MALLMIILVLSVLSGCQTTKLESKDVKRITVIVIGYDPASYVVFDANSDLLVNRYDFTGQWTDGEFDFLAEGFPLGSAYQSDRWKISSEKWEEAITAFNDNDFLNLSSELKGADVTDYISYYVFIEGRGFQHKSGGYAVDLSKRSDCKRFTKVVNTVLEAFKK